MQELLFEELEQTEELWVEYVIAGGAGIALGVVTYVAVAAAT